MFSDIYSDLIITKLYLDTLNSFYVYQNKFSVRNEAIRILLIDTKYILCFYNQLY